MSDMNEAIRALADALGLALQSGVGRWRVLAIVGSALGGEPLGTWCPQCGPGVPSDEDGCCTLCGATAVGDGADVANAVLRERDGMLVELRDAYQDRIARPRLAGERDALEAEAAAARAEVERLRQRLGAAGIETGTHDVAELVAEQLRRIVAAMDGEVLFDAAGRAELRTLRHRVEVADDRIVAIARVVAPAWVLPLPGAPGGVHVSGLHEGLLPDVVAGRVAALARVTAERDALRVDSMRADRLDGLLRRILATAAPDWVSPDGEPEAGLTEDAALCAVEMLVAEAAAMRLALERGIGETVAPACVETQDGYCGCEDDDDDCGCPSIQMRLCACGGEAPCTDPACFVGAALAPAAGGSLLRRLGRAGRRGLVHERDEAPR